MSWNWQKPNWPNFTYDSMALEPWKSDSCCNPVSSSAPASISGAEDQETLKIELISDEAVKTSEIEGEILNRDSVQSSLRHQLGLGIRKPGVMPAERGISKMMVDLYQNFATQLTDKTMFDWHKMLLSRRQDHPSHRRLPHACRSRCRSSRGRSISPRSISRHRRPPHAGGNEALRRHGSTTPRRAARPTAAADARRARASVFRLHSSVRRRQRAHRARPRGKIARAKLGPPSLIALAYTIERKRKDYYAALERNNKNSRSRLDEIFRQNDSGSADNTIRRVDFYVAKAKFYQKLRGRLNERQAKVIARMFREGIDGFKGGLSAENYISISRTSRATATRDLQDLVEKGALDQDRRAAPYPLSP